jgi:hypothetical protein
MPQGAHGQPEPGAHDRHLYIIDIDRNRTYSFYGWNQSDGDQGNGIWMTFVEPGCDLAYGVESTILTKQGQRFTNSPSGLTPGIGVGIDAGGGANNGPVGIFQLLRREDFERPSGDFGRAMSCVICGGQDCSPSLTNGYSWPVTGTNTLQPSGVRSTNGSLIYLDPSFNIPSGWPDWEQRLYRTYQRYGCYMYDDLAAAGNIAIRIEGTWSGELPEGGWDSNGNGVNPWEGLLEFENGALFPPNRATVAPHMKVKQINGRPEDAVNFGSPPVPPTLSMPPNAPIGFSVGGQP